MGSKAPSSPKQGGFKWTDLPEAGGTSSSRGGGGSTQRCCSKVAPCLFPLLCSSWAGWTFAFSQTLPSMKRMAELTNPFCDGATSQQVPHHQSSEAADWKIPAWAAVAFTLLILFLPALTAANTSSHTTLSCIALCLYTFLQLSPQASGLQQNSYCGSSSHRNCCQASVAMRGQPAQGTGKW